MNADVTRFPKDGIARAAASLPTPFFLYEEARLRRNCRRLKAAFEPLFPGFTPLYAVKANANPHVLRVVQEEGFGFDCSSPSELWLVNELGGRGMYTGNYTTREELAQVIASPDVLLNLDDVSAVATVNELGTPAFLSFRVNPGVTAGDVESLYLAGPEAKFGLPAEAAVAAYRAAREAGASRFGLHMMTGSNVLDADYFSFVTCKLLGVAAEVRRGLGIDFEYLNIGGGFGVPYRPEEESLDLERVARGVRNAFDQGCRGGLREPTLMAEPGRFITADAGFLVTRVHAVKYSYKKFVGVDAGTNDLPRPAVYGAYHHITILGKEDAVPAEAVNVVGRLCENNDQLARDRRLPSVEVGDVLVIHNAGGHCYAMGHNYNGRPRADEYLLTGNGDLKHIRRAETVEDLFRTVVDPPSASQGDDIWK
ncbi:MAG: diaminopimelate decarboxylase [candidate division Zixibacteria bacterium]|nr:diaminopimelate decarboxylase [candidate division Zixibacteria bacterium]